MFIVWFIRKIHLILKIRSFFIILCEISLCALCSLW